MQYGLAIYSWYTGWLFHLVQCEGDWVWCQLYQLSLYSVMIDIHVQDLSCEQFFLSARIIHHIWIRSRISDTQ